MMKSGMKILGWTIGWIAMLGLGGAISCDDDSNVAGDSQNQFACEVDEDCQMVFGELCIDGQCIIPVTGTNCTTDDECGLGSHCNETTGMCEVDESPVGDEDETENTICPEDMTCQDTMDCLAKELPDHECINGCCIGKDDPFEKLCVSCASADDCPTGALCLPDPESSSYCAVPCEEHGKCPENYTCTSIQGSMYCRPSDGYCGPLPAGCRTTGCPEGQYCNTQTNTCETMPAEGLGYCEPCTTNDECGGPEDLCLPDSTGNTFCGVDCSDDQPCTMTNSYCMRISEDGSQKQCFPFSRTCPTASADCRETGVCEDGLVCEQASGQCVPADCRTNTTCEEGTTCDQSSGYCVPEDCRDGTHCPTGTSCNAETGECVPNDCREPGGYCPEGTSCSYVTGLCVVDGGGDDGCQSDYDCPLGYVCNPYTGICEEDTSTTDCREDPSICSEGYVCNQTTGFCEYDWGCFSDDDCPTGQVCDRWTGECVTGTSRCSDDSDCDPGEACDWFEGTCSWQQCNTCRSFSDCEGSFDCVNGYCLDDCSSNSDCPSGHTCQRVDWDNYCLPESGSCGGGSAATWCPGYSGYNTCCYTDDPCGYADDGECDCSGTCDWDAADCSGSADECSGRCSGVQDNTCMEDGVSLCFCGENNQLTVVDCEEICLEYDYDYFHHCGYHSEVGYEVCQCSNESGGDDDPTECSGSCYGDDPFCIDDDTLCRCDSDTYSFQEFGCDEVCREGGYDGYDSCGYSSIYQQDGCFCTCDEGGPGSCDEPLEIDVFPYVKEGTTFCLDNDLEVSACTREGLLSPRSVTGPELLFRFTARSGYRYRFQVAPTGWDALIAVYESTGCVQSNAACWHYDDNRSTASETAEFDPPSAGTYYVAVQYYDAQGGENEYTFTALEYTGDVCPGYTGTSSCCTTDDPCDWANDDYCDCDGACDWDEDDCSGSGDVCPGYTGTSSCCTTDDPCDWANDDYCDCDGTCDWDGNDCSAVSECTGSCSFFDSDYCVDDGTVCACERNSLFNRQWTVYDCQEYCAPYDGYCSYYYDDVYCECDY